MLTPVRHPAKKGLSLKAGQARLLHDLANIELQAMELGLRTLFNFPDADMEFKADLAQIVRDEAKHLKLCLDGIARLGFQWGDWPIHNMLWDCTSNEDSFLDRIVIVHCYLEGSGLDAGDTLLRKLSGVHAPESEPAVQVIAKDELAHVQFGTHWYVKTCKHCGLDPEKDFPERLRRLSHLLPTRREKINHALRQNAGFTTTQIEALEDLQSSYKR
ncbi:MAG: DUF455 family protein [Bdellovibrionales bacterium]